MSGSRRSTGLLIGAIALIVVFMVSTLGIALWQEDLNWGWWWTVPVGGAFLAALIGFRVLVQRAQEAERAEDLRLDRLEDDRP